VEHRSRLRKEGKYPRPHTCKLSVPLLSGNTFTCKHGSRQSCGKRLRHMQRYAPTPISNLRLSSDDADRKILCDRDVPTCRQCTRSKRTCKGYGLQLSWPRPGDGRRAMVVRQQHSKKATEGYSYTAGKRLIHAHSRDVELHYYLTTSLPTRPTMHIPLPYSPSPVDVGDLDLLQYCIAYLPCDIPTAGN